MSRQNDRIIKTLKRMKSVDLSDPVARNYLVTQLSSYAGPKRENVAGAIQAYANTQKDKVVNTRKEREVLAVMITREANRARTSAPFTRGLARARKQFKSRRYNFQQSQGKGVRKFDGWKGFRVADANTQFDARRLAQFIRKNMNNNKVRVVEYQAGKKTHYSVYSAKPVTVANKSYVDVLAKGKDQNSKNLMKRVQRPGEKRRQYLDHQPVILVTKKRIPELGLRMRMR